MILCCCRDLSGVVDMPFSDCAVLVVWPSSDLNYCFAAVSACTFSVQARGIYVPVYSFGVFATLSMLVVWTCGFVGLWLDCRFLFSLGCSVLYGRRWLSLLVFHFFGSALFYGGVLDDSCLYLSYVH